MFVAELLLAEIQFDVAALECCIKLDSVNAS